MFIKLTPFLGKTLKHRDPTASSCQEQVYFVVLVQHVSFVVFQYGIILETSATF